MKIKDVLSATLFGGGHIASGVRSTLLAGGVLMIAVATLDPTNITESAKVFLTTVGSALGVTSVVASQKNAEEKKNLEQRVREQQQALGLIK